MSTGQFGEMKIMETEDGFRVEVKGKTLGQMLSRCCCVPVTVHCGDKTAECCTPEQCCPPGTEKKT